MRKILVIIGLSLLLLPALYAELFVIRFDRPAADLLKKFSAEEYDVASCQPGLYLDLVVNDQTYQQILDAGYQVRITQTEAQLKANLKEETELNGYQSYSEMLAALQLYEAAYPNICKLYDIGDSRGKEYSNAGLTNYNNYNHEIWALKVSDNVELNEDEPSIYYLAEHHAREPISLEVTMTVLDHILANYGSDPVITNNVNNTQIWFVPLVNPNGHKVVTDEINIWWRKNICDNNGNGSLNVTGYTANDGVDPNRNYGWQWGGASNNWTSETYQGTEPFSEPETQAVRDLLAAHHFVAGISYHSYGELILFPYGYEDQIIAPDQAALSELCTAMALSIPGQNGGFYTPQPSWALYPCTGTTDDYAYGRHGIFGYTIELATEFIPPASQVATICNNNIQAALILLDRLNYSILKGHITEAATGQSMPAKIFVDEVDNTGVYRNPYLSNEEFGSYYRLLTDGSYDVSFSSYGYETQTIENVSIISGAPTIVDIAMQPASANAAISGTVINADTGEPVADATVEIPGYGIPPAVTNAQGEYTISGIYQFVYDILVYCNGYAVWQEQVIVSDDFTVLDFEIFELDDGTFENSALGGCWEFGGNSDWLITSSEVYEGMYSIRSGVIDHNQKSDIQVSLFIANDSDISFFRKVSSENNYDYLKFYIDNVLIEQWSGNQNWAEMSYPVAPGIRTFRWSYAKDGAVANGSDCGWLDNIVFPSQAFLVTPLLLEFLNVQACYEGLEFSIINTSGGELALHDITQSGSVFGWYIEDFSFTFPYLMAADEQLDLLVKVDLPLEPTEEILADSLFVTTEAGQKCVQLHFDNTLLVNTQEIPAAFSTDFQGNFPNPFNPSTTFRFSLAALSRVRLNIYNLKGQLVKSILDKELTAGRHQVIWQGDDSSGKAVSSGVYFARMDADDANSDFTSVRKIILLK